MRNARADQSVETSGRPERLKHVWILNHYAQEPGGAGGTRHYSLARHLPAQGWHATIISAATDHVTGRTRIEDDRDSRDDVIDGVRFLWLRTRKYSGNGGDRIGNMVDYTRRVLQRKTLSGIPPPDAIIGSSVHPLAAWAGRRLAARHRVPFVFEVRDLWPQTLIDMGRIAQNHPVAVALRALEKSLYRSAAKIIVLLPKAGDYIEPMGISASKIVWIPNGADLDLFPPSKAKPQSETFTLMYFGAHGGANGLDNLLHAMRIVRDDPDGENILLRLIGDGPLKPSLIALAEKLGLENVRFETSVPKSEIPTTAAQADAFVVCIRNKPNLYRFGISLNKIFDYMAACRPTVISVDAANNPIASADAGLSVVPDNPAELAGAIVRMARLPISRRREMGEAGRKHLEDHYSMLRLSRRLGATLDECLNAK